MFKASILIALMAFAATGVQADKKIVCYFGSWSVYRPGLGNFQVSDIDPRLCTHMTYTFTGITTNGDVNILDPWADLPNGGGKDGFGKFTALRHLSPGTKAMVAIGGWNEGSLKYSQVASDPATRARFVQNVVKFLKKYDFDGFDVDWEYPNQRGGHPYDKKNFVALLKDLREEFDKYGYILGVAVAAAEGSASQSYIISEVSKHADLINLMAYDFNGSWNKSTGINAPLYASASESPGLLKLNIDAAVRYWLSEGAPPEKLILGVPSYGRSFTLANANDNGIGALATGPGIAGPYTREQGSLGYNEICANLREGGWTVVRESDQRVPYAFKGNQWVGYDDVTSVLEKAKYINSMGLGGAMMWSVETDDFRGTCGSKYPLLNALNSVLRGNVVVPDPDPNPSEPTGSTGSTGSTESTRSTSTSTEPAPPSDFVCVQEGYVRNPHDCSTFHYCQKLDDKYLVSTFHCPTGLAFDPSIIACNYKDEVSGC
ncbi:chitinase-3-like protein 1 [Colletes gigas]|uniref:chitinase-3-like protein 1 n=1 Tax=Colletes gigas TaxID=935657 RepID=UPI001C9BBB4B|nr:chitinase-3-like protein 1 [Colletes gigas]